MKNRKNLGCLIKGNKERGAWAELYFMALAAGHGLRVSNPYGGFASYDVGVEGGAGPILRIQVKCTFFHHPRGGYGIDLKGPGSRGYPPGSVDFFALYVGPNDDWYIVPYAVVGMRYANLHFTPGSKRRRKYGKYLEAWHLLLTATKKPGDGQIEIRACCEIAQPGGVHDWKEKTTAKYESRVRKMFRGLFQK
jgi:PD-(D/E)XK nuclease superfamily protein